MFKGRQVKPRKDWGKPLSALSYFACDSSEWAIQDSSPDFFFGGSFPSRDRRVEMRCHVHWLNFFLTFPLRRLGLDAWKPPLQLPMMIPLKRGMLPRLERQRIPL